MGGVDDRGHLVVLTAEVLDDERGIVLSDKLRDKSGYGVGQERGLVAPHQKRGRRVAHGRSASSTRGSSLKTCRSCTVKAAAFMTGLPLLREGD